MPTVPLGRDVVTMVKGDVVEDGMLAVQDVPALPAAHESQIGPLSPVSSATTLCMSCTAATICGYGAPLTLIIPKSSFSPSGARPFAGSSTYWNQSSPTSAGVSSYRGATKFSYSLARCCWLFAVWMTAGIVFGSASLEMNV